MADHPILFSAPMVRALLDGRKTQTRRIIKPQPTIHDNGHSWTWRGRNGSFVGAWGNSIEGFRETAITHNRIAVGDRLWVRETWQGLTFGDFRPTKNQPCEVRYFATDPCADLDAEARGYLWRPSIFMPRFASRLTLTVTEVRVEPLQDISDRGQPNDCIAEGVFSSDFLGGSSDWTERGFSSVEKCRYHDLWNAINGPGAWDANPWLSAYTFTVERKNIDEVANG